MSSWSRSGREEERGDRGREQAPNLIQTERREDKLDGLSDERYLCANGVQE